MRNPEGHSAYLERRRRQRWAVVVVGAIVFAAVATSLNSATRKDWLAKAPLDLLQQRLAATPNDDDLARTVAYRLMTDGRSDEALPIARRLVARRPQSALHWFALGRASALCGLPTEAVAAYRKASELDPKLEEARSYLGQIYGRAGLITDALAEMDAAKKIANKPAVDPLMWANCLIAKGRSKEAWDLITAALKQGPLHDELYAVLGKLATELRTDAEAETLLRRRIAFTPMYPVGQIRTALSQFLLARSQDAATLREVEEIMRTAVKDAAPATFAVLAQVLVLKGDFRGARAAAQKGLKQEPNNAECLTHLAEACRGLGDTKEEEAALARLAGLRSEPADVMARRKALQRNPADSAARVELATALHAAGKHAEAAEECLVVLRASPNHDAASAILSTARAKAIEQLASDAADQSPLLMPRAGSQGH